MPRVRTLSTRSPLFVFLRAPLIPQRRPIEPLQRSARRGFRGRETPPAHPCSRGVARAPRGPAPKAAREARPRRGPDERAQPQATSPSSPPTLTASASDRSPTTTPQTDTAARAADTLSPAPRRNPPPALPPARPRGRA